jgi:hypothetical protein
MKKQIILTLAVAAMATFAFTTPANAALIAGCDFENTPGGSSFDRTPDDLDLADGITVSADWTASANDLKHDGGAQVSPIAPSTITARLEHQCSWSITIPDTVTLDLTNVSFDVRGATGSDGSVSDRAITFTTSLDASTTLYSNSALLKRPTWTSVSVDLTAAKYKNLTDTTVTFNWEADNGGVDIDTITVSGTVPEPATMSLLALGGIAMLRRRRRA